MFVSLCFAVAGWLGCPPCGLPVDAVETAPMPRAVPAAVILPVGPARHVRPWVPPAPLPANR